MIIKHSNDDGSGAREIRTQASSGSQPPFIWPHSYTEWRHVWLYRHFSPRGRFIIAQWRTASAQIYPSTRIDRILYYSDFFFHSITVTSSCLDEKATMVESCALISTLSWGLQHNLPHILLLLQPHSQQKHWVVCSRVKSNPTTSHKVIQLLAQVINNC